MRTPVPDYLAELLAACDDPGGELASYIPQLTQVDPDRLAIAICTPDGTVYSAGDDTVEFTIQSISKPFVYALALRDRGPEQVLDHVGVEPSGDAFHQISVDRDSGRPRNPMINIGAITTHCLVGNPGLDHQQRAAAVIDGLSRFAGRDLSIDEDVFASEYDTRYRNMALASMVRSNGLIDAEPEEAVWGYARQCSALVTVQDLAVMAMTLARGGVNPINGARVAPEWVCRQVLAVMTTCGMYDAAGDWLSQVGIPAKSGVGGGIIGAMPGQVGIGVFSPRLDEFGHSVRGVQVCELLSEDMGLHIMGIPAPSIDAIGARSKTSDGREMIELRGPITFPSAELALRRFEQLPPDADQVVVDLAMVTTANRVGRRMLREGIRRLRAEGRTVEVHSPSADLDLN